MINLKCATNTLASVAIPHKMCLNGVFPNLFASTTILQQNSKDIGARFAIILDCIVLTVWIVLETKLISHLIFLTLTLSIETKATLVMMHTFKSYFPNLYALFSTIHIKSKLID